VKNTSGTVLPVEYVLLLIFNKILPYLNQPAALTQNYQLAFNPTMYEHDKDLTVRVKYKSDFSLLLIL